MDCRIASWREYLRSVPLHCLLLSISLWLREFFLTGLILQKCFHFKKKAMIMCLTITGWYLCCHLSQKLSKIVLIQDEYCFPNQNLSYDGQYGFRKIYSSELAVVELVVRIHLYMGKGRIPLLGFLQGIWHCRSFHSFDQVEFILIFWLCFNVVAKLLIP